MKRFLSEVVVVGLFFFSSFLSSSFLVKISLASEGYENFASCFFELVDSNHVASTYNLSYFHLNSAEFKVTDSQPNTFLYLFNFCGTIPRANYYNTKIVPISCYNAPGPCLNIVNKQCVNNQLYNVSGQLPLALQLQAYDSYENYPAAKCHWLGAQVPSVSNYNIYLLDPSDAGRGVVFEYINGEWCSSAGINRKLRVELICPDSNRAYFKPSVETNVFETVIEDPDCVYTVTYTSPLACPSTCITGTSDQKSVCNGKGICASDPIASRSRCLCDKGWTGEWCTQQHSDTEEVNEDHSGIVSAIVICIVLLALILGLSAWLCYRIRVKEEEQKGLLGGEFFSPMLANQKTNAATDAGGVSMGQVNPSTAPDTLVSDHGDDNTSSVDAAVTIN